MSQRDAPVERRLGGRVKHPTLPDHTGCAHVVVEVFAVYQCTACARTLNRVEGGLQVQAPLVPPGPDGE